MYNRYMRNDDGSYTRIPEEEPARRPGQAPPPSGAGQDPPPGAGAGERRPPPSSGEQDRGGERHGETHRERTWEEPSFYGPPPPPPSGRGDGLTGFLRHFLDQWHLDSVDTGDLLLLGLLFFLFREDADEELLVALGLLLIL